MARKNFRIMNRPKSAKLQFIEVRREARKTGKKVADRRLEKYQEVVANWENKPEFEMKFTVGKRGASLRGISLIVVIANAQQSLKNGSAKIKDLWWWIDFTGTTPHKIRVQNARSLSFIWGGPGSYTPKTTTTPTWGGPGTVSGGSRVNFLEVDHPGFEPRRITEHLDAMYAPQDKRDLYNAYRRGFRRATR